MATEIDYKKEYLPGYTGHVPKKMEVFACTAGETNRIIINQSRKPSLDPEAALMTAGRPVQHAKRTLYSQQAPQDFETFRLQFTNASKKGDNWIGGPTQNVKAQYIPGYQGFVPNIKSENIFGKSFAKNTGIAVNKEFESGFNHPTHKRYLSQAVLEHGKANHRRLINEIEPADVNDMAMTQNFNDVE